MVPSKFKEGDKLDQDFGSAFGMEDGGIPNVFNIIKEFRSLNYKELIPLEKIFNPGILKKKAVRWVLLFGLLPLLYGDY